MIDKYVGKTIGIYNVIERLDDKDKDGHALYRVQCNICGATRVTRISTVITNHKKCFHTRHCWANRRIGMIFNAMVQRCYNSHNKSFRWYGAKGITVCNEWLNDASLFEKWALSSGYADNLTIDRINPKEGYSPNNCQWISNKENSRRAGNVNLITVKNKTLTGRQWALELGLGQNCINRNLRRFGLERTIQLIEAVLENPQLKENVTSNSTLMAIYNIV